jgi:Zn-dependent protease with chaperone function
MNRIVWLREFQRFLTYTFRQRISICTIILSIPGMFLFSLPVIIRLAYVLVFVSLAMIPIFSMVQFVTGSAILQVQICLHNRKHKPEEIVLPEVKQMAQKMGIVYDKPIYVTDNPLVKGPFINLFSKAITFPSTWFKSYYHRTEILAGVGHELGHIKGQTRFMMEMLLASLTPVVFILVFALSTFALGLFTIPLICQLAAFALLMLAQSKVLRRNEIRADTEGAKVAGAAPMIALFEALKSEYKEDEGSETHPSLQERIERLLPLLDSDSQDQYQ